jgi:hypothetical protein
MAMAVKIFSELLLSNWTTSGVSLSEPDTYGRRSASVVAPVDATRQFLRLVIIY